TNPSGGVSTGPAGTPRCAALTGHAPAAGNPASPRSRNCQLCWGRGNSALRRPGQSVFPVSEFGEDPGFQERFHQRAYSLILDPRPEAVHQSRVRYFVKTGFDVALQDPLIVAGPGGEEVDLGDRVLRAPV